MTSPAEQLFRRLSAAAHIESLIGESENCFFDCKEWPANDGDAQRMFAKAACGMANAEGGVLIVGMKARSDSKDEPDVVVAAAPVSKTKVVRSKILDWVGQLIEPVIPGVEAFEISEAPGSESGFVTVYIPACEGSPRRSRKDWKFYLRIGSGTHPMEYFQLADMFGKRPSPLLSLYLEQESIIKTFFSNQPSRSFVLGLINCGRGIAKFPSIRFSSGLGLVVSNDGIDGMRGVGLPRRASEAGWNTFRGGVDDVIYPGEKRLITRIQQFGQNQGPPKPAVIGGPQAFGPYSSPWLFEGIDFECEIYAEGIPMTRHKKSISEIIETVTVVS
jgi:Putative DNA-binding domain